MKHRAIPTFVILLSTLILSVVIWKNSGSMAMSSFAVFTGLLTLAGVQFSLWQNTTSHSALKDAYAELEEKSSDLTEKNARIKAENLELEARHSDLESQNRDLEESVKRWEKLALTDAMTDISNHRAFRTRLQLETSRAERYGYPMILIILDVDNFKQYNDKFGHPAGDRLLRRLAGVLQDTVRDGDFVARYGGEEFAVILPQTDLQNGRSVTERLRAAIEKFEFEFASLTVSLGAAEFGLDAYDAMHLTNQADRALIASKSRGKNRVTFYREIETPVFLQDFELPRSMHDSIDLSYSFEKE